MLEIRNLHVRIGDQEILKGLDLTINPGEVHSIMGPNGSGKSTLAQVLAGRESYEVTEGEILFEGKDLLELALKRGPAREFSSHSNTPWKYRRREHVSP
mgnify:CR=1 FL=1